MLSKNLMNYPQLESINNDQEAFQELNDMKSVISIH